MTTLLFLCGLPELHNMNTYSYRRKRTTLVRLVWPLPKAGASNEMHLLVQHSFSSENCRLAGKKARSQRGKLQGFGYKSATSTTTGALSSVQSTRLVQSAAAQALS
ncbi:hypothetical protein [Rheinheimera sp. 4Y26]|uniref:hypothetical protein n=1 Tax=Rheinheimera sp. 4Y26 TaxID=2977811 RepID=UPI0021B14323|nr:hypothetical protein [Rheinheimera sp. 4Y26]MCT6698105.1 hypothetical protein [Rheinheimera sp. 4Y26]